MADPPMPHDDDRARPAVLGQPAHAGLAASSAASRTCARAGRDRAQHAAGVAGVERRDVVEQRRRGHAGLRASSTSRTGMSSRTG
jgi:hypothetical protein